MSPKHLHFFERLRPKNIKQIAWLVICYPFFLGPSSAADIRAYQSQNGKTIFSVRGDLEFGDEKVFANLAIMYESGIVVFNSPGGNAHAGIEIGKMIRLKRFNTYVMDDLLCASACAFAWLGGSRRYMSSTARIGFHAVYTNHEGGQKNTSSTGNALLGAYLSQLGLSQTAIFYISEASPYSIRWLSIEDAQSVGIDVSLFDVSSISNKSQSFPKPDWCWKAASAVEETICNDRDLSRWELSYLAEYNKLTSINPKAANEIARSNYQRKTFCGPEKACLANAYSIAINALRSLRGN